MFEGLNEDVDRLAARMRLEEPGMEKEHRLTKKLLRAMDMHEKCINAAHKELTNPSRFFHKRKLARRHKEVVLFNREAMRLRAELDALKESE